MVRLIQQSFGHSQPARAGNVVEPINEEVHLKHVFFHISHTRAKYVNKYHGGITQKHRYLRGKNIALKKGVIYIQSPAQIRSATTGSCRAFD